MTDPVMLDRSRPYGEIYLGGDLAEGEVSDIPDGARYEQNGRMFNTDGQEVVRKPAAAPDSTPAPTSASATTPTPAPAPTYVRQPSVQPPPDSGRARPTAGTRRPP